MNHCELYVKFLLFMNCKKEELLKIIHNTLNNALTFPVADITVPRLYNI